ncbi:MAG: RIP metalloprotease RseP [Caloramator sp.]|nr:RIP metalloprotease RseP [Caloramator sp.]
MIDLTTLFASIFVFGLLITAHELGHFILAKINNVKVLEFSIGMGPRLFRIKGNETEYSIRLLPIGGYVKMLGEEEECDDPRAFRKQSPWKRLSILIAGAFMNFVLAIILFIIIFYNVGVTTLTIDNVVKDYPAFKSGIKPGDKIIAVNGSKVSSWNDFLIFMNNNKSKEFVLTIKRDNIIIDKSLTPIKSEEDNRYIIGITPKVEKGNLFIAISSSINETIVSIKQMLIVLGGLITRKVSADNVGGPVAIIKMSGEAAKIGIWSLLYFAAFLSINLGIMNLIPFPALDGGWVVITFIEGITGRKIDENKIGLINLIGFTLLMLLAIIITYRDILRIFA